MLRPPHVKNNASDHKNARLSHFGSMVLPQMLSYAKKAGLDYYVCSPSKGLINAVSDGGLLILSRYPIVKSEKITFKKGVLGDRYCAKGAIYAKIVLGNQNIHIVNTHLQSSSTNTSVTSLQQLHGLGTNQPQTPNTESEMTSFALASTARHYQILALKEFIDDCTRSKPPHEPLLVMGGFNVNARPTRVNGRGHSDEYINLMRVLTGEVGVPPLTGSMPSARPLPNIFKPIPMRVRDVALEACAGEHPITFGDVLDAGRDHRPREVVLSSPEALGCCASIDYILWMGNQNQWGGDLSDECAGGADDEDDVSVKMRKSTIDDSKAIAVDIKSTRIERFLVDGEPYTQLSDHYGLSTVLTIPEF
ncbi:hypothetical protein HK101_010951 [Irineochytrium annulatum]|nr:hypothetical protein HK101_010951 [Irineochytrium annulatum]